jgi:xylan 1,4-beta-xylosidase
MLQSLRKARAGVALGAVLLASAMQICVLPATHERIISIDVDTRVAQGPLPQVWNFFGYDEPNFTYMPNGRKLLEELSRLSASPVYIRTHNLLTSGDGTPALKWGSTNVYSQGASGKPVYDWAILDRIFDAYRDSGVKPLVEIGFMPEALSVKPEPYRHSWPSGPLWTGWAYPPKDYNKWAELVYQFAGHLAKRYSNSEAESWFWEVWNEPNIGYWQGQPEEYHELYDFTADALKRALPGARIGGPATTGPANPEAAEFLRKFLEHCTRGQNYATGRTGAPLDYISFHAKGSPRLVGGHVEMGISRHLQDVSKGFEIVASLPELRHLPIILSESDPEGCAACSAQNHPENAYRNGPLYASYVVAVGQRIRELAERYKVNLAGVLTWAFEFEDQPYFAGFRTLATNGVDKPVLNAFRMMGLMPGDTLATESTGAQSLDSLLQSGVRQDADIGALATRKDREINIVVWSYHDDDLPASDAAVDLTVKGLGGDGPILVCHYRVDLRWSNSYSLWRELGSPQAPSEEQYRRLEAAGQLQLMVSPQWVRAEDSTAKLTFALPRQAVSLIRLSW